MMYAIFNRVKVSIHVCKLINSHDTSRQLLKVHIGGKKHLPKKKILCNDNDNGDADKEKAKARTPSNQFPDARCQMPNPKDQRPETEKGDKTSAVNRQTGLQTK